ncbi:MAG TPA: ATP-dependent DNA helicase RecG [Candidatus Limnocylindrales bacterium]|nr:ATP-dependent DNA helicase RecG [Candidatus Limnocylindrales bacterium]
MGRPATSRRRPPGGAAARPASAPPAPPLDPVELLSTPLAKSGLSAAPVLRRAGIRLDWYDVRDLLFHLPRRYDDLRELSRLGDLVWAEEGIVVSARVRVADIRVEASFRRRIQRTVARLTDDSGEISATWFGRRYIEKRLHAGDEVVVSGRLKRFGRTLTIDNPEFQTIEGDGEVLHAGRIVPVYRLTAGLTSSRMRIAEREALDLAGHAYPEYLPAGLRDGERLIGIAAALESAHYPRTFADRDAALHRLAFDELLALQIGMVGRRRARGHDRAPRIGVDPATDGSIRSGLTAALAARVGRDVTLTVDQHAAIEAIRADLAGPTPMLRLLQGDVGSGKTAVAAYALAAAARAGYQAALLAPTDLLARQHLETVGALLADVGVDVVLIAGSLKAAERSRANEAVASGQASVVVGTHALFSESVSFARLGLAIVDEQHRFGVEQRGLLEAKAAGDVTPHVLLMTATPIPRTLGQVLYADLDVSDLRTPPAGRIPIRTGIRTPDRLDATWQKVRAEAAEGHRTFVVVPLVEEGTDGSDDGSSSGAVAAETEAVRLTTLLAPLRVGLVHGRMKPIDRDAEMGRFRDGALDVLVGTTVIEVGVDVPAATMMVVEGADRFGLAQLHQLRGRVGRGTAESYCVLVSDATDATAVARLRAIAELSDGFELAERDFELRREGDVLGFAQSGLPGLRVASLVRRDHQALAVRAREHAEALVDAAGVLDSSRADLGPLTRELAGGWLRHLAAAEPASGT